MFITVYLIGSLDRIPSFLAFCHYPRYPPVPQLHYLGALPMIDCTSSPILGPIPFSYWFNSECLPPEQPQMFIHKIPNHLGNQMWKWGHNSTRKMGACIQWSKIT